MDRNRKRRIVRRATLIALGPLLLLSAYISSWLGVSTAAREGVISWKTADTVRCIFVPVIRYCDCADARPGASLLGELWWRAHPMRIYENERGDSVYCLTGAHALMPTVPLDLQVKTAIPYTADEIRPTASWMTVIRTDVVDSNIR